MSLRKELRRWFTWEEKRRKKTLEYDFGSAESVRSESKHEPIEKEPQCKRSKSVERAAKSGNQELHRPTNQKNPSG